MAFHYKTQGIILKQRDSREADRIITAFTKDFGKLSLWASGERKIASKLRAGLELFCLSNLSFVQGRQKKVVVEAIPLCQYAAGASDPAFFHAAFQIAGLVDRHSAEQEQDKGTWELLLQLFGELKENKAPQHAYQSFVPRFMSLAGYGGNTTGNSTI